MTTAQWYAAHNCDHAHCEQHCDKPQPTFTEWVEHPVSKIRCLVNDLICQRCLVVHGEVSQMLPCTPGVCR